MAYIPAVALSVQQAEKAFFFSFFFKAISVFKPTDKLAK